MTTKSFSKANNVGTEKPNIYHYTDYRLYLKDVYEFKKGSIRGYSYRVFSNSAGFSSPNILKLVIEGQRNIGDRSLGKFVKALQLSEREGDYFATLVKMNQAQTDSDKNTHMKALLDHIKHVNTSILPGDKYRYLSDCLLPVVRELSNHPGFSADPHWIANRLHAKLKLHEIAEAVKCLLDDGFIVRLEDGTFRASPVTLESSDDVINLSIRNYHRSLLQDAAAKIEDVPISHREFGALTFNLPKDDFVKLKTRVKNFFEEIHYWMVERQDTSQENYVVQLNIQLYPHNK